MRRPMKVAGFCAVFVALAATVTTSLAQGPGSAPGAPMQRLGPARGPATGLGAPGAPMARMGRGGGVPQASPSRRSYGGMAGVMSSQQFRSSSMAGQFKGGGMQRSSAAVVGGVTQGAIARPSTSR